MKVTPDTLLPDRARRSIFRLSCPFFVRELLLLTVGFFAEI